MPLAEAPHSTNREPPLLTVVPETEPASSTKAFEITVPTAVPPFSMNPWLFLPTVQPDIVAPEAMSRPTYAPCLIVAPSIE